jgi:hypothetical protein
MNTDKPDHLLQLELLLGLRLNTSTAQELAIPDGISCSSLHVSYRFFVSPVSHRWLRLIFAFRSVAGMPHDDVSALHISHALNR